MKTSYHLTQVAITLPGLFANSKTPHFAMLRYTGLNLSMSIMHIWQCAYFLHLHLGYTDQEVLRRGLSWLGWAACM
jgi:hypothetical protein